jgi:hypothetical protein
VPGKDRLQVRGHANRQIPVPDDETEPNVAVRPNVYVNNAGLLIALARQAGFSLTTQSERLLPPDRRYLPPSGEIDPSDLAKRLRRETVLVFRR